MRMRPYKRKEGFALLLAIIVASVVLAIGVSILDISVNQINLSATARESEFAFQTAHAGMDCIWYWRFEEADIYTTLGGTKSSINCFGINSIDSSKTTLLSNSNGHINSYKYTLEWGTPARCNDLEMVVFNASDGDLVRTFSNKGVGENGVKRCEEGNVCTVLFSQGYNRACDELTSSIFSIQRELVVEF